jgi:coiled-coil and C2 domain-containing protein 2A
MPDLYCTSQEFLDLGAGDYEEHAILLCNFFNYIDKIQTGDRIKSYLLLGKGNPEGKTAYVLRRDTETDHIELWNAMKGEAYFFGKEALMDKIGCINVSKGSSLSIRLNDPTC